MDTNKRVVVFFWDGWISVSPSIINTLLLLHKNGYEVDCITRQLNNNLAEDIIFPKGINIFRYGEKTTQEVAVIENITANMNKPKETIFKEIKKRLGIEIFANDLRRNIEIILEFYNHIKYSKKVISNKQYSLVIGVDTEGLVTAGMLFYLKKITKIYFSLEIKFITDFKFLINRILKRLEKHFHKKVNFTIIQDKYRLESLFKENNVIPNLDNFVIVPNGSMGLYQKTNSTYFKDMFNFSDNDVIILHAGGLSSGMMNDEIAESAANWPENFKLVFHFSGNYLEESEEIQRLKKLSKNKAYFSLRSVTFDKLPEITSSAHIGIAFYNKNKGPNHTLIVGASGKMANYFKCGIPCIALNLKGFKELFDEYNCGVVIDTPEKSGEAIKIIMNDYKNFKMNSIKCYNEAYEFEKHFNKAIVKIKE